MRLSAMFIEYIRILGHQSGDAEISYYHLLSKVGIDALVGMAFIYLGYKLLGKYGAFVVFLFEAAILLLANNVLPFKII